MRLFFPLARWTWLLAIVPLTRTFAQEPYRPLHITTPPVIDGKLDDPAWQSAPCLTGFKTYSPDYGKDMSEQTEAFMAYDDQNLYFAFRCLDREPGQIKASMTSRDKMFADDWVCVNLDTFGDQQNLYAFYVNPLGIQGDSRANSQGEDRAFDTVWQSAGLLDNQGYCVEIAIPLRSIRFSNHNPVGMRIAFERSIPRRSEQGTLPALDPAKGNNFLTQTHPIEYHDLRPRRVLELLPSFTYTRQDTLQDGELRKETRRGEFSLSGKYGISPDLILDATYNPDFSYVEADAGQVDINLRSPLFFQEKRPFFLEGDEYFRVAGKPMIVYSRQIQNPLVALKLTGKIAPRHTVAMLYALDETDLTSTAPDEPNTNFTVLRYLYTPRENSYLGGIFTERKAGNYFNQVGGFDGQWRTSAAGKLVFNSFFSRSRLDANTPVQTGSNVELSYNYNHRDLGFNLGGSRMSEQFQAEVGHLDRTGVLQLGGFIEPRFYPGSDILRRVSLHIDCTQTQDLPSGLWETQDGLTVSLLLGSTLNVSGGYTYNTEIFVGHRFNVSKIRLSAQAQATKRFYFSTQYIQRRAIYYSLDPYAGYGRQVSLGLQYQITDNLSTEGSFTYSDFYRKADRQKVYDYPIYRLKTTYQLNKYLFFRGIVEYNQYRQQVTTDFLASFTYIPGTVMYAGYGSLYERPTLETGRPIPGSPFIEARRGLFLKASYLWRF